jgi:MFS family permease
MGQNEAPVPDGCPLGRADQTRNLVLFAACTALQFLAAPVLYVGVTQASLCHELGATDRVANLPESAYLGLTFAPVILAWLSPGVGQLRRNLVLCYAAVAASQAAVAACLPAPLSPELKLAAVIAQAAVAGVAMPSGIAFLWELIGRGAAESRRGLALALAFGVGPGFAVLGSLGTQLVLRGELGALELRGLPFPVNFAVLYAAAAPVVALAAVLACFFVVPIPPVEAPRQPFAAAVFGGLWGFLRDRVLLTATVATILLYAGNTIAANLNLYTKEVFGEQPMLHAGYQNAARFAFKMTAGLLLGWLLTRASPKLGLVVTALLLAAAVLWAMFATPATYLLVFGIFGAGELVGVYAPNYILSASRKEDMRRNMAFVTMMMAPAAPAGYLFGTISDVAGAWYGKAAGFRISFAACLALVLAGALLAAALLPARPARQEGA